VDAKAIESSEEEVCLDAFIDKSVVVPTLEAESEKVPLVQNSHLLDSSKAKDKQGKVIQ